MQGRIRRVNDSIERTGGFRLELLDLYFKVEEPRIMEILGGLDQPTLEEAEAQLARGKISPELITYMKREGGLLSKLKGK